MDRTAGSVPDYLDFVVGVHRTVDSVPGFLGFVAVAAEVLEPLLGSGSQWCQFHRRKKKERT